MSTTRKPRPSLLGQAALDPVAVGAPPTEAPTAPRAAKPASRDGARGITFYVDPEVLVQLKILSAKRNTPLQDLMIEAVNLLFQENDMARIAKQRPRGR